jgi:hypothetical protein
MKHLSDTEKYLETRATLEYIVQELRRAYNHGFFDPNQKKYIFTLLREGDTAVQKVSK